MATPTLSIIDRDWWYDKIDMYVSNRGLKPASKKRYEQSARQLLSLSENKEHLIEICMELGGQPYQYANKRPIGLGGLEPLKTIIKNIGLPYINEYDAQIYSNSPISTPMSTPTTTPMSIAQDIDDFSELSSTVSNLTVQLNFQDLEEALSRVEAFESIVETAPIDFSRHLFEQETSVRQNIQEDRAFEIGMLIGKKLGFRQGYDMGKSIDYI